MALLDAFSGPWTEDEAAHLARRAGLGASSRQISDLAALDRDGAVASFVDYDSADPMVDALLAALPAQGENPSLQQPENLNHLQGRWLFRFVHTPNPLQEQLTLFLHDMVTTEWTKVRQDISDRVDQGNDGTMEDQLCGPADLIGLDDPLEPDATRGRRWAAQLLLAQNDLMRTMAAGNYAEFLKAVTRDPAMLIYLDNKDNRNTGVQENFSRELMELFSMGVGNYSEEDVVQLARILTGETLDDRCERNFPLFYLWDPAIHASGNKTFLGEVIPFSSTPQQETDQAIDLILRKVTNSGLTPAHATLPAATIFIAWRLLQWFLYETIAMDDPAVAELAVVLDSTSANGYRFDLRETLRVLFTSQLFYDPAYRYAMVKHPVDYAVTPLRALGLEETSYTGRLRNYLGQMGMDLFDPPDVNGWDHGRRWIYSGALIGRFNYANELSRPAITTDAFCDGLLGSTIASPDDDSGIIEYLRANLLHTALRQEETDALNAFFAQVTAAESNATLRYRRKLRGCLHLMMTLPRYQLK